MPFSSIIICYSQIVKSKIPAKKKPNYQRHLNIREKLSKICKKLKSNQSITYIDILIFVDTL